MKKQILIPNLLLIVFFFSTTVAFAQETVEKKPKTELKYALSGSLTVYEKPDITSKVIGQLIYNETLLVVTGSEQVPKGSAWVHIVSPYEGFYLHSKPPAEVEGMPAIKKSTPGERFRKKEVADKAPAQNISEAAEPVEEKEKKDLLADIPEELKARSARVFGDKSITMLVGIASTLYSIAEESGYTAKGSPRDMYFEYIDAENFLSNFRFGVNSYNAEDDDYTVSTISIYGVYRYMMSQFKTDDAGYFVLVGPAWMMSSISGAASKSAASFGMMAGGGGRYRLFGHLNIGVEVVLFSNQQDFDAVKRYVGSTQLLLTADYSF